MIRGAVAFGLVLRIDDSIANRSVIVTSSLVLVIFTTVFMGSTVSSVQRLLFGDLSKKDPLCHNVETTPGGSNRLKKAESGLLEESLNSFHEIF